jgi:hypothetical protein
VKDIYILWRLGSPEEPILLASDDIERCNKEIAKYPAVEQDRLRIDNVDLLEEGD